MKPALLFLALLSAAALAYPLGAWVAERHCVAPVISPEHDVAINECLSGGDVAVMGFGERVVCVRRESVVQRESAK